MSDKLVERLELLPDTIEKLSTFILIGREKLKAQQAKLKAIEIFGESQESVAAALEDTQSTATILLWAEARMGEILKAIPDKKASSGGGTRSLPPGINKKQSHYAQQLASNPKIIEEVVESAIKRKEIPRRQEALRAIKKKSREEKKEYIPNLPDKSERYELIHGDISEVKVEDDSLDWIITDPPYPKEYLPLIEKLGEFAQKKLKPSGSLICMIGQSYLPEVFKMLNEYLTYNWTCAYIMPGDAVTVWPRKVTTGWKPLLWYVRNKYEKDFIYDVFKSEQKDKNHHLWGQSESGMEKIIEQFTYPGELVCDPFLGGGTTGLVSLKLNRLFIGIDNNIEAIETTKRRFEDLLNDKA